MGEKNGIIEIKKELKMGRASLLKLVEFLDNFQNEDFIMLFSKMYLKV